MSEFVVDLTDAPTKTVKDLTSSDALAYLCGLPVREQIVRCRDCKRVTIDQGDHDYREPLWCGLFHIDVSLDGFCAWGVSKTVDK